MKRVRKEKRKLAERIVMKMTHEGDHIEQNDDLELFSLSKIGDLLSLEESNKLIGDTSQTGVDDLVREEMKKKIHSTQQRAAENQRLAIEGRKRVHFERRVDDTDKNEDYLDELCKTHKGKNITSRYFYID